MRLAEGQRSKKQSQEQFDSNYTAIGYLGF